MHITMRVACRIARACTREVATNVFTLAGLIVSAVAHAPLCSCILQWCNSGHWLIDRNTSAVEKNGEKLVEGASVMILRTPLARNWFRNLSIAHLRQILEQVLVVASVRKIVERLMNFYEIWFWKNRFLTMMLINLI